MQRARCARQAVDRWAWLITAARTQLRLARPPLAKDLHSILALARCSEEKPS
ncbi:hypothetical protein ABZT34_07165 [Streptomyces sp. NPDC005329]|uniref:hypothetical protein n=1 Tax=Streptomyces sp. NPDC005329 TaxID=3157034 RepID=UPI0033BA2C43